VSDALDNGHNVLIHCLAGAHRAGVVGVACLMFLKDLDAVPATNEAHEIRSCIDPSFDGCGFDKLLLKLQRAQKLGLLPRAVEEAKHMGYLKAWEYLFSFQAQFLRCCCCRRPRLEARDRKVVPMIMASTSPEASKDNMTVVSASQSLSRSTEVTPFGRTPD